MAAHGFGVNRDLRVFLTPAGVGSRVFIGAQDVSSCVRSITITGTVGEPTIVSLDLMTPDGMTAEGLVAALGLTVVTREELIEHLTNREEPG